MSLLAANVSNVSIEVFCGGSEGRSTPSNSDSAAAAERAGAVEARMVSAKRTRVRCCQPPATETSS
ncbi:hypothetical protein AJ87_49330 [Rhizobium yanglingense]|nr:hypothetical protein AJ87_49330 [Rhizobium yanglingense]